MFCPQSNSRSNEPNTLITENAGRTIATEEVFQRWDHRVFRCLTCLKLCAILYFMYSWFSLEGLSHYPGSFALLTIVLMFYLLNNHVRWATLPYMRRPRPLVAKSDWKVAVVTTFVPGAEPIEMLEETLQALRGLDYPHDTWVLDEGDDAQVKALCHKLGIDHFSRKSLLHCQTESGTFQTQSKHGNYNAWLHEIGFDRYDIITAFDPDHIPQPTFLTHVLGYFDDPKVGYVQAAQAYYNQQASFIARGAAEETYAYSSSLQMASYGLGIPSGNGISEYYQLPQLLGCHNTHRITALKQIGGFAPHDADDLLATVLYWAHGWQGVYVPQILARGLAPVDWHGYLTQQRRWARAILNIKFRRYAQLPWQFSLRTRMISIFHGLSYLHNTLLISISLLLAGLMLTTSIVPNLLSYSILLKFAMLYVAVQSSELYRQRFYLDWHNEWGLHWRACILQFAKWPYMLLALYDVVLNKKFSYIITKKARTKVHHRMLFWPNIFIMSFIFVCFIISTISSQRLEFFMYIPALIVLASSLTLVLSEYRDFPHPYGRSYVLGMGKAVPETTSRTCS